jgi:succinyl-diaminopimelate desuccinylase
MANDLTDSRAIDGLLARIDAKRAELVDLTRALIRFPTVNPPGEAYAACAEAIGTRLAGRGFAVEYLRAEGAPGDSARHPRINVVARLEGQRPGPTIHFNGHIDVVEAGRGWTVDPLAAEIKDGRIYGRGACDMKGGLAAAIIAAEAIVEQGPFAGALEISGTVDEETGGFAGVAWLAARGYFSKPRVDHVIIPEPLNKDCVCLGHRGVWWAEIETLGRVAHGSMPFLGVSAIRNMAAFLGRLESDLYPKLDSRPTAMPVIPPEARRSTLNINSVHGGQPEEAKADLVPSPLVADSCRLMIDRRFLIEENAAGVKAEVVDLLEALKRERAGFDYRLRDVMTVDPLMTDAASPLVQSLDAGIARILGKPARHVVSPGTYDQKHVARLGHLKDCVAYGPGILELAHQPDEFIEIEDMVQSAKVMALATHNLQGGGV